MTFKSKEITTPSVEWTVDVNASTVRLYSENFKHDACLILHGDFESIADKTVYAQDLADRLNAQRLVLPTKEPLLKETSMETSMMHAFKTAKAPT